MPGDLRVYRALDDWFLATFMSDPTDLDSGRWVVVGPDGSLAPVDQTDQPEPLSAGDTALVTQQGEFVAYRPVTGHLSPIAAAPDGPPAKAQWYSDDVGGVCIPNRDWVTSAPTYYPTDGGVSWGQIGLHDVLPPRTEPYLSVCFVRGNRMTVVTGDNNEAFNTIHTIALDTRELVHSEFMGPGYEPLILGILRSGRTVWGLEGNKNEVVATDADNKTFVPLAVDVPQSSILRVLGESMYYVLPENQLRVSDQAGQTWQAIDLEGRGWDSTA